MTASTVPAFRWAVAGPKLARSRDILLVAIAGGHLLLLLLLVAVDLRGASAVMAAAMLALATVYTLNTVAHWHLHRPLFVHRGWSRALSLFLTLATFVPQSVWKKRHLWHHAGEPAGRVRLRLSRNVAVELAVVAAVLFVLGWLRPLALGLVVAPGFALGMALCRMQGHFEHAGDADRARSGVSHYGWLYNALWFNDGYHAEHHLAPAVHWTDLPRRKREPSRISTRAPLLRFVEGGRRPGPIATLLGALERTVLCSRVLERWVVATHARAIAALLADASIARIAIVGGGLFPRSVLVFRELYPAAKLVVIDMCPRSIGIARAHLAQRGVAEPVMECATFDPDSFSGFDLVVFPLAFVGDRSAIVRARARNRFVLTHDWLVHRGAGLSRIVSVWLWKRVTLHAGTATP